MIEPFFFPIRATELPYLSEKKKNTSKQKNFKIHIHVMVARACFFHREDRQKMKLTRKRSGPWAISHIQATIPIFKPALWNRIQNI